MATRKTAIIILIGATITWVTVLLALGFSGFLLTSLGLIVTTIWLSAIIWAGLISLRALAWVFILMGFFFLFFPFTPLGSLGPLPPTIGMSFVSLILICAGINFIFGLLSVIISFLKKEKALTTEEKKKYN